MLRSQVAIELHVDLGVRVVVDVDVYAFCFMAWPRINYVPKC